MSDLLGCVGCEKLKFSTRIVITLVDSVLILTNIARGFAARTTPLTVTPLVGEKSTGVSSLSNIVEISGESKISCHAVDRLIRIKLSMSSNSGSELSILKSFTVGFDVELFVSDRSVKWEFSLVVGSSSNSIKKREEDPHINSSIFGFQLVSSVSRLLSNGRVSIVSNNEGLPLTRFGGLTITINLDFIFGLIPVDSRRGGSTVSVDLKLTSKLFGDLFNDLFIGCISCTISISFTSVREGELEGKL
jgi:hypothetical protein